MSSLEPGETPTWGTAPEDPAGDPGEPEGAAAEPARRTPRRRTRTVRGPAGAQRPDAAPDAAERSLVRRVVTTLLYAVTGAGLGFVLGFGVVVLPFVFWAKVTDSPDAGVSSDKAGYVLIAAMFLLAAQGIVVGRRRRDPPGSRHRSVARRAVEALLGVLAALLTSLVLWFWSGNVAGALLLVTLPLAVAGSLLRPYRGDRPAWWPVWWPA